jgi:hypothetical protein
MFRYFPATLAFALHFQAIGGTVPTVDEPEFQGHAYLVQLAQKIHANATGDEYLAVNYSQDLVSSISDKYFSISGPAISPAWETRIELAGIRRECDPMLSWQPREACNTGDELLWKGHGVDMQFVHSAAGMRQNFIVATRVHGSGDLHVVLHTSGDLIARQQSALGAVFVDGRNYPQFHYNDLRVWDACGTILEARMVVDGDGPGTILLVVDDSSAQYPITVDPVAGTANPVLSGAFASLFGWSVRSAGDLNGDGYSDVVVGAPEFSQGQTREGGAFVYYGGPNGIGTTPNVTLQVDQAEANFGFSVGHAGDLNGDGYSDLAVGAKDWESSAAQENEGAVFIYYGSATGISSAFDIRLEQNVAAIANNTFGTCVAGAGDLNNDGYSDLIVGGNNATNGQTNEGLVWVFLGSSTGLNPAPAHILESDRNAAFFGLSIAAAGDINGDGFDDIVVGAHRYSLGCPVADPACRNGAVFVYHGSNSATRPLGINLKATPVLIFNTVGVGLGLTGWSVSGAGDVNGDGFSDVIIGDWRDDIGGQTREGVAVVYHGSTTGLVMTPATIIQNNIAQSWMGRSVSSAGDVNGDGYADILVGGPEFSSGGLSFRGRVQLHLGGPAGISASPFITYQGLEAGARMGESVAVAGDVNGDGYSDFILSTHNRNGASVFRGGPYMIGPVAPAVGTVAPPTTFSGYPDALSGSSVANAGDVNGDGYSDVLVGAPEASNGQTNEGLAFLYYGSASGLASTPDLTLEMNVANARFGYSVATAGDVNGDGYADVVIGAPEAGGTGRAYIFHGGPGGLTSAPSLILTGTASSRFGHSVSTGGDINSDGFSDVLIGAPSSGTVSVHLGSVLGLTATPHELLPNPQVGSNYGWAVATAGDVNGDGFSDIVIGAPDFSNGQAGEGVAFVHHGSEDGLVLPFANLLERNQAGARFGFSVAGAGDMNGDGFFDVAIGAPNWRTTQVNEGAMSFHPGSAAGVVATGPTTALIPGGLANINFGSSVAEGGDINGDGYADLLVGAPLFSTSFAGQGRLHVFSGRPGLPPSTAFMSLWAPNVAGRRAGASVAGGGDIDGDGFSDVIVGQPNATSALTNEGAHTLLRGNWSPSVSRPTRLYMTDLVNPLATNGIDPTDVYFGIGHYARSHMQRKPGRLKWEVVFEGQPYSGGPASVTNSILFTAQSATWTDLGITGVEIKELIFKEAFRRRYKWRVRVEYPIHRSMDGQKFSRWFYGFASAHGDIGVLPLELIDFTGDAITDGNLLKWTTASETGTQRFVVERSNDATEFREVGALDAAGDSWSLLDYQWLDRGAPEGLSYYRLRMEDLDGAVDYSPVILVRRGAGLVQVHPNPVADLLVWDVKGDLVERARIMDGLGRIVVDEAAANGQLQGGKLANLPAGAYTLLLLDRSNNVIARTRFLKA